MRLLLNKLLIPTVVAHAVHHLLDVHVSTGPRVAVVLRVRILVPNAQVLVNLRDLLQVDGRRAEVSAGSSSLSGFASAQSWVEGREHVLAGVGN
jgi:hypothetical protein